MTFDPNNPHGEQPSPHQGQPYQNLYGGLVPQNLPVTRQTRFTRRARVIAGFGGGVVALVAVGTGGYFIGKNQDTSTARASTSSASVLGDSLAAAPATKAPSRTTITAADFRIDITILKQKCFGSAGCNVTYTIEPTFLGVSSDLTGRSFRAVYEVIGGEDIEVGNFSLDGTNLRYTESSSISTPSADAVLTAQVTTVVETS